MEVKRIRLLSCEYEPKKYLWKCDLDGMEEEPTEIVLEGTRSIELFPLGGKATIRAKDDTYCFMSKEDEPYLICNTDRERLERMYSKYKSLDLVD